MRIVMVIFSMIIFCNAENIKAYGSNPVIVNMIYQQDQKGRKLIDGSNPVIVNMIYLLNPQSLIGFNYKPYKEDLEFIDKSIHNLPVIGGFMNGTQTNLETLIKLKPQVVFTSGNGAIRDFEKKIQQFGIRTINLKIDNLDEMLDSTVIVGKELDRE